MDDLRRRIEGLERREEERNEKRHEFVNRVSVKLAEEKSRTDDLSARMARMEKGALGVLLAIAAAAGSALLSLIGWTK